MAVIPFEMSVLEAQSNFIPSIKHKPRSPGSKEYQKLAATLVGEKYKPSIWKRIFRLGPKKEEINRELFYERLFD